MMNVMKPLMTTSNEALNDNKLTGCIVMEPMYEDNNYVYIEHIDPIFDECHNIWYLPHHRGMAHEKMKIEYDYFTSSRFSGNIFGCNPDLGRIYHEMAREMAKRLTSNKKMEFIAVMHSM